MNPKGTILKNKVQPFLFLAVSLFLLVNMLLFSKNAVYFAALGLNLWFERMIPSLFPFMILSGILVKTGFSEKIASFFYPVLGRIFGLSYSCIYIILMGFLCGFPMGAAVISENLQLHKISKREASYLLAFTNNIGPVYFISFVSVVCPCLPLKISFAIMYGIPLLYGIILRYTCYKDLSTKKRGLTSSSTMSSSLLHTIDSSIQSSIESITKLGGYMILFNLLNLLLYFPYLIIPKKIRYLSSCLLEISGGIQLLKTQTDLFPFVYIILPFGGLSCIAQTYHFIKNTGLSIKSYLGHKIIQTACTAIVYFLFMCL